jgi:hypothetical protein
MELMNCSGSPKTKISKNYILVLEANERRHPEDFTPQFSICNWYHALKKFENLFSDRVMSGLNSLKMSRGGLRYEL